MEDSPFPVEYQSDQPNCQNDATAVSICLLGQVDPSDPINFCNPQQCDHGLDGIDNRDFGFAFQDFPPSYWAI